MKKPRVCILRTDGTNCDQETSYAFTKAGAVCEYVHVNQLRRGVMMLDDYHVLVIPGGFSYGDDVVSGKILAVELLTFLREQLMRFVVAGKLVIGICNGFQVLVRTGLLPFRELGTMPTTLLNNEKGKFQCQWVDLRVSDSSCVFTQGMNGLMISLPAAHGEGRFFAESLVVDELAFGKHVPLRYVQRFNGSMHDIAGVCDMTGRVFGLMPHPERFVDSFRHPLWQRMIGESHGLLMIENGVRFAQHHLV